MSLPKSTISHEVFVPIGHNYSGNSMYTLEALKYFFDILKFSKTKDFLALLKDANPTIVKSEYFTPKEFKSTEKVIKMKYYRTYKEFQSESTESSYSIHIGKTTTINNKISKMNLTYVARNRYTEVKLYYTNTLHSVVGTIRLFTHVTTNIMPFWQDFYNVLKTKIDNLTSQDKKNIFGKLVKSEEEIDTLVLELQRQVGLMQYPVLKKS